jgi:hypothetical protein
MYPLFTRVAVYGVKLVYHGGDTATLLTANGLGGWETKELPAKGSLALEIHGKSATLHSADGDSLFGATEILSELFGVAS